MKRYSCIAFLIVLLLAGACSRTPASSGRDVRLDRCIEKADAREFDNAMELAVQCLSDAEHDGDPFRKADALCVVSLIDLLASRDAQAWKNACEAEDIARGGGMDSLLSVSLILKGRVCSYANISADSNRDDEAIAYLTEALDIASRKDLSRQHVEACYHLSEVYVNKNRWNTVLVPEFYDKAGAYLREGESLARLESFEDLIGRGLRFRIRYLRQGGGLEEALRYSEQELAACPASDWLTRQQLLDQITVMRAELGRSDAALESHRQYVYAMQQYIRQRSDSRLQELEERYDILLQREEIERKRVLVLLLVLLLALAGVVLFLILLRNRLIRRKNADLEASNSGKEKLLAFLSADLANPGPDQRRSLMEFAQRCRGMDDDQIREFSENLVREAGSLNEDVARYVYELSLRRKAAAELVGLTAREMEIVRLSCQGLSAADIADRLHISPRTVTNHKQNIYAKMGVKSNAEMIFRAKESGLI